MQTLSCLGPSTGRHQRDRPNSLVYFLRATLGSPALTSAANVELRRLHVHLSASGQELHVLAVQADGRGPPTRGQSHGGRCIRSRVFWSSTAAVLLLHPRHDLASRSARAKPRPLRALVANHSPATCRARYHNISRRPGRGHAGRRGVAAEPRTPRSNGGSRRGSIRRKEYPRLITVKASYTRTSSSGWPSVSSARRRTPDNVDRHPAVLERPGCSRVHRP